MDIASTGLKLTQDSRAEQRPAPPTIRMAYLFHRYPSLSHAFHLREVLGLRLRNLHLETASLERPGHNAGTLPPAEAAEAASAFYLSEENGAVPIAAAIAIALAHPVALLRGLAALLRLPGFSLRKGLSWPAALAQALILGRWMHNRNLTHLHAHFGDRASSVAMLVSAAWSIPFSLTVHDPDELLAEKPNHLRAAFQAASFIFCLSDFSRNHALEFADPNEHDKFQVVRIGVDPMMLTPNSRSATSEIAGPGPRTMKLISIGRLVPAKGHSVLLEALYILRQRGIRMRLTLVGGGEDLPELERLAERYGLKEVITFTSALSHSQTLALLRRADLFALAGLSGDIPVALMEAMSLGLPCVSTEVAGIPELIRNGVDGLLVAPGDAVALADALGSVAVDDALRTRIGYSARQRIITQYNLPLNQELLVTSFDDRLRKLAGRRAA